MWIIILQNISTILPLKNSGGRNVAAIIYAIASGGLRSPRALVGERDQACPRTRSLQQCPSLYRHGAVPPRERFAQSQGQRLEYWQRDRPPNESQPHHPRDLRRVLLLYPSPPPQSPVCMRHHHRILQKMTQIFACVIFFV